MKRVFTNKDQVLHLWANQSQNDARCSNVFFEGTSCYSYGYHYELGRLVEFNGVTVALINNSGYSVTTAKHIRSAYSSVSHLIRVETSDFSDIRQAFIGRQDKLIGEIFSFFSRRKTWLTGFEDQYYLNQLKEFNESCLKLGFKDLTLVIDDHFKELWSDHHKTLKVKENVANELFLIKAKTDIDLWLVGEKASLSYKVTGKLPNQLIRINGELVETTGGAEVPLSHALRLLRLVETKEVTIGEKVGHFKVDKIGADIIQIGCHNIELKHARTVLTKGSN